MQFKRFERLRQDETAAEPLTDDIINCEINDLRRGDVPYFFIKIKDLNLYNNSGIVQRK
jgi:lantibiotic modifying enzyme